ncbi:antibiotic biosynthesis monooxygenase [Evansella cellulosilytica]|uniref:Antibiotic biosynthesis monooxygenase n=1 Tax=Evansella cellulosilytica (strain ATCC 21833 / DSM 2522 / FERM P-1141 / JCM 9156 / N-4) TaxID=649639 RepID=E6TVW7_EVAC2|nr:antibiotic biosynthesis monooxygenase [Evansella cellulosilytica]ADU28676.1 Antibiotic biosynthesis monooxygenase [Evansella cellulosilytica DSM 2522]
MLIQTRTITVKPGYSDQVVDRFSGDSPIDTMDGLIDRTVVVNRKKRDQEEVMVMIRWESLEAWKNWEKSDAHIQGHRNNKNKEKPEYILDINVNMYEVKAVKKR